VLANGAAEANEDFSLTPTEKSCFNEVKNIFPELDASIFKMYAD